MSCAGVLAPGFGVALFGTMPLPLTSTFERQLATVASDEALHTRLACRPDGRGVRGGCARREAAEEQGSRSEG